MTSKQKGKNQDKKFYPKLFQATTKIKFQPTNQNKREGDRKKYTLRINVIVWLSMPIKTEQIFNAFFTLHCIVRMATMYK